MLAENDRLVRSAADGRNLALHLAGIDSRDALGSRWISQFYFRAVFALYPHRVFIGRDDRVINNAEQLTAADIPAGDDWLQRENVPAVLWVDRSGQMQVRPVR